MRINLGEGKLVITFKYDPKILDIVRVIPGRQFNLTKKRWEVPLENALECLETLIPLGFVPSLDVNRLAEAQRHETEAAEEIRTSPADYNGDLPLFDFQKVGARFLKTIPNVLLADSPGTGKTLTTIAALEDMNPRRFVVFCPASLKFMWAEEIKKWKPTDTINVIDGIKIERHLQWQRQVRWTIANYELLLHDWDSIPKNWDVIISDESTRISNPSAKTTKVLKKLSAKKRIALTGTPISNKPDDIWSIIDWISPRYLGSYYQFTEQYCIREPRFNRVVGYKNLNDLGKRISRFMLRRTKEEVMKDLPPKIIEDIVFDLSKEEMKLYIGVRNLIAEEIAKLDVNPITLNLAPVKMLRLKQAVDHPTLITKKETFLSTSLFSEHSSKLEALKDIIAPLMASNEKVIIFSQFAEMCKILFNELNIHNPRMIIGEVSAEDRQKAVEEFRNNPECLIMIMSEAGAMGLNLQVASYVVNYDLPWSAAKYEQRVGRAHRIGQDKPVTVYNLIARKTIDEYCLKVLRKKYSISNDVLFDDDRLEEAGLTEEDIKIILNL